MKKKETRSLLSTMKVIIITIFIVIIIRSFILESNYVSSGSMSPTLITGDYILTTKFNFGLLYPFSNKKMINYSKPKKGEIVVFLSPSKKEVLKNGFHEFLEKKERFIKRVVATENDTILIKNQTLYINGKKIERIPLKNIKNSDINLFNSSVYKETLGSTTFTSMNFIIKVSHTSDFGLNKFGQISYNKDLIIAPYKVPNNHFFVIGDNRDDSFDSRFFGPIKNINLQGKAFFRWFSYKDKIFWNRIFELF